ncbi:MAG: hypothetical protein ABEK59_06000 [Halobacteria archaeon]
MKLNNGGSKNLTHVEVSKKEDHKRMKKQYRGIKTSNGTSGVNLQEITLWNLDRCCRGFPGREVENAT